MLMSPLYYCVLYVSLSRLGDETPQAGGIKKFLQTGSASTVGPSALSRNSSKGGNRGGKHGDSEAEDWRKRITP